MRIVFVIGFPLLIGGHFKSAAAMAAKLTQMGHTVRVLAPGAADEMRTLFRDAGAELAILPALDRRRRTPRPFIARQLVKESGAFGAADLYHALDLKSASVTYLAAALTGKPFVLTIAGGPVPSVPLPPRCHTVVFSGELLDGLRERAAAAENPMHLIRARIDTSLYRGEEVESAFIEAHGLPLEGKKVVFAMRLVEPKRPWVETLVEAAEELTGSELDIRIAIAGDGPLLPSLRADAERIVRKDSREPVLFPIGPIFGTRDLIQLYNYADVVVGSGRGIMEAMACSKPVIVLGERGEGELITEASVEDAAYTNFSGRHFRERLDQPKPLAEILATLLGSGEELERHGRFSYEYILAEQDARLGAEQLVQVYEQALRTPARRGDFGAWSVRFLADGARRSLRSRLQRLRHQPSSGRHPRDSREDLN